MEALLFDFYTHGERVDYTVRCGDLEFGSRQMYRAIGLLRGNSFTDKHRRFKQAEESAFRTWATNKNIPIKQDLIPEALLKALCQNGHNAVAIQNMSNDQILDEAMRYYGHGSVWRLLKSWHESLVLAEKKGNGIQAEHLPLPWVGESTTY